MLEQRQASVRHPITDMMAEFLRDTVDRRQASPQAALLEERVHEGQDPPVYESLLLLLLLLEALADRSRAALRIALL